MVPSTGTRKNKKKQRKKKENPEKNQRGLSMWWFLSIKTTGDFPILYREGIY